MSEHIVIRDYDKVPAGAVAHADAISVVFTRAGEVVDTHDKNDRAEEDVSASDEMLMPFEHVPEPAPRAVTVDEFGYRLPSHRNAGKDPKYKK